jgi:hypothetical protein
MMHNFRIQTHTSGWRRRVDLEAYRGEKSSRKVERKTINTTSDRTVWIAVLPFMTVNITQNIFLDGNILRPSPK